MHLPKPSEGGSFTPPPAGTFPAICYRIIDLGTQDSTYLGKPKRQHKVLISWELKDDEATMKDPETGQIKPMTIHQRYTWSTHEKSRLRKDLESWRGKKFSDDDFGEGGFDIRNLLGAPCYLGIVHSENGEFANISAISKLPRGMDAGELVNPKTFLSLDRGLFDKPTFESLSDKLKDTIRLSPEYRKLGASPGEHVAEAENPGYGLDDEIPF